MKHISFTELIPREVELPRGTKRLPKQGCIDLEDELALRKEINRRTLLPSQPAPAMAQAFRGVWLCCRQFR
jgi:hypothetical protein